MSLIVIELPDEGSESFWVMVLCFILLGQLDGRKLEIVQNGDSLWLGPFTSYRLVLLKALTKASSPLFSILESIPQP